MSEIPATVVLDASALLALFKGEPGGGQVDAALSEAECLMSGVNLAEFIAKLVLEGASAAKALEIIRELPLEIIDFSAIDALCSAELICITKPYGLSLGDRACLALAKNRRAVALTADRVWTKFDVGVKVACIRPESI